MKHLLELLSVLSIIIILLIANQSKNQKITSQNYKLEKIKDEKKQLTDLIKMGLAAGGTGDIENYEISINNITDPFSIDNYYWRFQNINHPLKYCFVTSEFNDRRINKYGNIHYEKAVDFKSLEDYRIYCGIDGIIKDINYDEIYGNSIIVIGYEIVFNEISEIEIKYNHLESINMSIGQIVVKDDILGIMGNTGKCMIKDYTIKSKNKWRDITEKERLEGYGKHLDFNLKINGVDMNPLANSLKLKKGR